MRKKNSLNDPQQLPLSKRTKYALLAMVLSIGFSLCIAEVALRVISRVRKWAQSTKSVLDYSDTKRQGGMGPGGLLKENFSGHVSDGYGGTVRWTNNSQGFRSDVDFSMHPSPGVLRILSLGDSFMVGYRVGQGKTISDLIERQLEAEGIPCEMLISCIESPFRGLEYLQSYGYMWNPQAVLVGVTLGNDIAQDYISLDTEDIGFRHGLENYDIPSCCLTDFDTGGLAGSAIDWFVRRSHLFRAIYTPPPAISSWYGKTTIPKMFDACHGLGFYISDTPAIIQEAFRRHFKVLTLYSDFCKEHDILLVVLVFPQRFQVQSEDWQASVSRYHLKADAFDILHPNNLIHDFCQANSIALIDPTEYMAAVHRKRRVNMYLLYGDMHWNANGHQYWFEGAQKDLQQVLSARIANVRKAGEVSNTPISGNDR